jgi:hypothetical protein
VILEAGAEMKENPVAGVVVFAEGVLRLMTLGLDTGAVGATSAAFVPRREDDGETVGRTSAGGEELVVNAGLKTGVDEHAEPVTVTVAVDSKKTVLMPSCPVEVKAEMPFGKTVDAGAAGGGVAKTPPGLRLDEDDVVGAAGGIGGATLEGRIPPKLNVLVGEVALNWRLFSLMIDGEAAGALRSMMGGLPDGCGAAA